MSKPIVAIMYDFDKTLSTTDMQNFSFIPSLGMSVEEFWGETGKFCNKYKVDKILGYMYVMILMAKEKGIKLTKEYLFKQGKDIKYYEGVLTWFSRINEYALSKGLICEHYLVTSGNKEIVEGTSIAKEFKNIFGCEYHFDEKTKEAIWPKNMINYTQKTQYFFRISKGVINTLDDDKVNEKTINRRIPYKNMIYVGDGLTDVPCMILVKQNGGNSIAVYQKNFRDKVINLLKDDRVNYIAQANYKEDSELDKIIKLIIDKISVDESLERKQRKLKNSL